MNVVFSKLVIEKREGLLAFPLKDEPAWTNSAFGILKAASRSFLTVFLSFFDSGVSSEHALFLERKTKVRVHVNQRFRNGMPQSAGLRGNASSADRGANLKLAKGVGLFQGQFDLDTVRPERKVMLEASSVDRDLALPRFNPSPSDCVFPFSRCVLTLTCHACTFLECISLSIVAFFC